MKDRLYKHAKDFNQKAMNNYTEKEIQHFLINLAISAELLGKAFLAAIHPSVIVNNDFDSLLHICEAGKHSRKHPANIRTIGAREVFKRCSQILPKLKDYERELNSLADIRNGLVHLGEYDIEIGKQIFMPYLKYTKIVLEAMSISFDEYFGTFSKFANTNILDSAKEIDIKVQYLITKAKTEFQKKFETIEEEVKEKIIKTIIASYVLTTYEEELVNCPACNNLAVLSGSPEIVSWEADFDEDGFGGAYPIVDLCGDSFKCDVCGLKLSGSEELETAGIETSIKLEDVDPADFIEPDYEDWEDR